MVRAYALRGKKRKNREESYERDEKSDGEEEGKEVVNELEGIQLVPTHHNNTNKARFIFILQNASLEVAKVGKVRKFYWNCLFYFGLCGVIFFMGLGSLC